MNWTISILLTVILILSVLEAYEMQGVAEELQQYQAQYAGQTLTPTS